MSDTNITGHPKRTRSMNKVIYSPGPANIEGKAISYNMKSSCWILEGKSVGSLSSLCKALGRNVETHQLGFPLQAAGYKFRTPFSKK